MTTISLVGGGVGGHNVLQERDGEITTTALTCVIPDAIA